MTDCPHMTGAAACTVCQKVAAVEGLLALAARVSTSPNMTVEVRHVRYALDKRRVPDLLAGKKVGQAAATVGESAGAGWCQPSEPDGVAFDFLPPGPGPAL